MVWWKRYIEPYCSELLTSRLKKKHGRSSYSRFKDYILCLKVKARSKMVLEHSGNVLFIRLLSCPEVDFFIKTIAIFFRLC